MTLKQDLMIKELEQGETSIKKAAEKAGYSKNYASSYIYQDIRKPTNKVAKWLTRFDSKDEIYKDLHKVEKICLEKGDMGNKLRSVELRARMGGHLKQDSPQVNMFQVFSNEAIGKINEAVTVSDPACSDDF